MNENLKNWINDNYLDCNFINEKVIEIKSVGKFLLVDSNEDNKIIQPDFDIIIDDKDYDLIQENEINYYLFKFGDSYFYSEIKNDVDLNIFRYLGEKKIKSQDHIFPNLGIHGKYELLNGLFDYKEWITKAKFLQTPSLAICEKNTLAGTISFQNSCLSNNIKPIIGETITLLYEEGYYEIKLYVKNEIGWRNLLYVNSCINVFNEGYITENELIENSDGLICVFSHYNNFSKKLIKNLKNSFCDVFFQLDCNELDSDESDKNKLIKIKKYLNNYIGYIEPVLIYDSYYLEKTDFKAKKILNSISGKKHGFQSKNQYYKSINEIFSEIKNLFSDQKFFKNVFKSALSNAIFINKECDFLIDTKTRKLPQFKRIGDYQQKFETNDALFYDIIKNGLKKLNNNYFLKHNKNISDYIKRIENELIIIKKGGFVDYFLILWDIIIWCKENNILVGVGRGSAGGSLVSYLCGITRIDPIVYDLSFERFLNEARIKKSLPDIDVDFESDRRDDIKRYIENRYGDCYVTSIGTYANLKTKAGITDIGRSLGLKASNVKFITTQLPDEIGKSKWKNIFKYAFENLSVKDFVQKNYELINILRLCLNMPKSYSIHASAIVIIPKGEYDIYRQIPVKKIDNVLVSEWEGEYINDAGFLKEDILGLHQLDKFRDILSYIKKERNENIDLYSIDLEDLSVYNLFHDGYNQDLFHFGSYGLTSYSKEVKPININELIAMISLYRPGAMQFTEEYVLIKNGFKTPEYDYLLEEVTRETGGLYIYQEQIMKAVQILGNFTATEADEVRSAMGKMKKDKLNEYKNIFIENAKNKGCEQYDAIKIWNKLEAFGGYGFNKSHATAYAIIGYTCQWLKKHYPMEFWSVSLKRSSEKTIPSKINEIQLSNTSIKIKTPDINKSTNAFEPDFDFDTIFWSLLKIDQIGPKTVEYILEERNKNGDFYSFSEFYERIPKNKVNKSQTLFLILSGAFDKIENINDYKDRKRVVEKLYENLNEPLPDYLNSYYSIENFFWMYFQKKLTGFGEIDYKKVFSYKNLTFKNSAFSDYSMFKDLLHHHVYLGGILLDIKEQKSKRGYFGKITIDNNNYLVECVIWNEEWMVYKDVLFNNIDNMLGISGKVVSYKNNFLLHSSEKTQIEFINF